MAGEQAEAQGQPVSPDEYSVMMAQTHELLKDDAVSIWVLTKFPNLLPAISHLIATSRLPETSIKEMKLRWRRSCRLEVLVNNENRDMASYSLFDSLINFGYSRIEDARNAHRAKTVTERIRSYKIEGSEKRKKFLGLF